MPTSQALYKMPAARGKSNTNKDNHGKDGKWTEFMPSERVVFRKINVWVTVVR